MENVLEFYRIKAQRRKKGEKEEDRLSYYKNLLETQKKLPVTFHSVTDDSILIEKDKNVTLILPAEDIWRHTHRNGSPFLEDKRNFYLDKEWYCTVSGIDENYVYLKIADVTNERSLELKNELEALVKRDGVVKEITGLVTAVNHTKNLITVKIFGTPLIGLVKNTNWTTSKVPQQYLENLIGKEYSFNIIGYDQNNSTFYLDHRPYVPNIFEMKETGLLSQGSCFIGEITEVLPNGDFFVKDTSGLIPEEVVIRGYRTTHGKKVFPNIRREMKGSFTIVELLKNNVVRVSLYSLQE